jgi:hypothetical protein
MQLLMFGGAKVFNNNDKKGMPVVGVQLFGGSRQMRRDRRREGEEGQSFLEQVY